MAKTIFLRYYDTLLDFIDRIFVVVVKVAMAVMSVVLLLQVFFRYVLNDSLAWGWDVPRVAFIWAVMFSIPLGIRFNAHVGIDLLFDKLHGSLRRMILSLNALLILILSMVIAYYSAVMMYDTWDQNMPGIPLSVGVFYASLLFCQLHTGLHIFRIIVTGQVRTEHWEQA